MSDFSESKLFQRFPELEVCQSSIRSAFETLKNCFANGGKLLVMGNGGSSADAEHFCGELVKGFVLQRKLGASDRSIFDRVDPEIANQLQYGFPAISLGVAHSLISAFANDMKWDFVFAQQIHVLAGKNDVIFAISTSGNSKNVVWGLKVAKAKNIRTIALTGEKESQSSFLSEVTIRVPRTLTHEIQELHLPIYHALAIELEKHFYASSH